MHFIELTFSELCSTHIYLYTGLPKKYDNFQIVGGYCGQLILNCVMYFLNCLFGHLSF